MAVFSYRCPGCDARHSTVGAVGADPPRVYCETCDAWMKRDYRTDRPLPAPVWQEHWNPSTNSLISDRKQLAAELRRKSDEASEHTGIAHSYVPVDRADIPSMADLSDV